MRTALLALVLAGCGRIAPAATDAGVIVEQHAVKVPSVDEVTYMIDVFNENAPVGLAVDEDKTLVVEWHAEGEAFRIVDDGRGGRRAVIGQTPAPDRVQVSSATLLMHELAHVALWRTTGDPDVNHAAPPGPWTDEVEAAVSAAIEQAVQEGL